MTLREAAALDVDGELIASKQAAAAGDVEEAQRHWQEFVRLLFIDMQAKGRPVVWRK